MDSKKIQALLIAVETGSFTKAADILGYTQSGLTHMMNSLEKELGFQVLLRGNYGIKLTPEGEKIAPYMRSFLKSEKHLTDAVKNIRNFSSDHIKVGAYSNIISSILPEIVDEFRKNYPNSSVEIISGGMDELYTDLYEGRIDIALLSYRSGEQVKWVRLGNDELMAVLPNDDEHIDFVPITDFNSRQFLMPNYGLSFDIMQVFNKYDINPYIKSTLLDDASVIAMVEHNFGISILSRLALKDKTHFIKSLPLYPKCFRELGIACLPKEQSLIARKFIEIAVKCIGTKKEA